MQSQTWLPVPPCFPPFSSTRQRWAPSSISTVRAVSINPQQQSTPPALLQKSNDDDIATAEQARTPLLDCLIGERGRIQANFFCPGHKQGAVVHARFRDAVGSAALRADLPELPSLDNLFAPEGVISDAQDLAADAFTSSGRIQWSSFFLVNGTTSGIEAALLAYAKPGTHVILPRNAHQSAVHALVLCGAVPHWIEPVYNAKHDIAHGITPDAVSDALDFARDNNMTVSAVLLVSPTYHGALSDVRGISNIIREHTDENAIGNEKTVLIVDEAHGAHLAFNEVPSTNKHDNLNEPNLLPQSASECGADIVLHSVHKTLPAFTQAALMHANRDTIDEARVRAALQLVQSSSPNYLLLASIDSARALMSTHGNSLLKHTVALADDCAQRISELSGFSVLGRDTVQPLDGVFAFDRTRLTILLPGYLSGYDLDEKLIEQHGVYVELPAFRHLTLVFTVGSTQRDVDQFMNALASLVQHTPVNDSQHYLPLFPAGLSADIYTHKETASMTPRDAFFSPTIEVPTGEAIGEIAADTLCPYPPGIPVVLPGEIITEQALNFLNAVIKAGGSVSGANDETLSRIRIVKQ